MLGALWGREREDVSCTVLLFSSSSSLIFRRGGESEGGGVGRVLTSELGLLGFFFIDALG